MALVLMEILLNSMATNALGEGQFNTKLSNILTGWAIKNTSGISHSILLELAGERLSTLVSPNFRSQSQAQAFHKSGQDAVGCSFPRLLPLSSQA